MRLGSRSRHPNLHFTLRVYTFGTQRHLTSRYTVTFTIFLPPLHLDELVRASVQLMRLRYTFLCSTHLPLLRLYLYTVLICVLFLMHVTRVYDFRQPQSCCTFLLTSTHLHATRFCDTKVTRLYRSPFCEILQLPNILRTRVLQVTILRLTILLRATHLLPARTQYNFLYTIAPELQLRTVRALLHLHNRERVLLCKMHLQFLLVHCSTVTN